MDGSAPSASNQGVLALEDWEQPPRRQPGPAAAPVLAVDGFEGPLDWLLNLARTRRIDLARLSIVALVEAFADALTAALASPDLRPPLLSRWGDWLVMAADLTLLRSRLLVPADAAAAQDAQDEAERLRQRLLGRAEISRAADWLEGRGQLGRDVFGRGQADGAGGRAGWADRGHYGVAAGVSGRGTPSGGSRCALPGVRAAILERGGWGRADPGHAAGPRGGGRGFGGLSAGGAGGRAGAGAKVPDGGGGNLPGRAGAHAGRHGRAHPNR